MTHTPDEQFRCRKDGLPWPCPQAQSMLLGSYQGEPGVLILYLANQAAMAARVNMPLPSMEIARQFFGWLPSSYLRSTRAAPEPVFTPIGPGTNLRLR